MYWSLGQPSQAISDLEVVIRQQPGEIQAYMILGKVHTDMGQIDRALADYEEAIRRLGSSARDHLIRARAYEAIGDYSAAASDFQKAKQMASRNDDVLNAIAWFRATCPARSFRDGREALQDSTKACEMTEWKSRHVIDTVAASYAELGDFENAIKYELEALNMTGVSSRVQKKMQERLRLYQQHKPFREESRLRQARTKSAG